MRRLSVNPEADLPLPIRCCCPPFTAAKGAFVRSIFGILRFDGHPVDTAALHAMGRAVPSAQAISFQRDGVLGLGAADSSGEHQLQGRGVTDLEARELRVASARLDNRADLIRRLTNIPDQHRDDDNHLVMHAHRAWGEDCMRQLFGDWSFAAGRGDAATLFVARDHFGHRGLYYYHDARQFVFASALVSLLAVPGVPRELNPRGLVTLSRGFSRTSETAYRSIHRLPPAHCLTVSSTGIRESQYWDPREAPDVRFGSDEQYAAAFREVYMSAVRSRVSERSATGVTLSGGLDSGSTAVLAAEVLAERAKTLVAFSAVPAHAGSEIADTQFQFGDERPYIQMLAAKCPNLDVQYLKADDVSPLAALQETLGHIGHPFVAANNVYWLNAIMGAAAKRGIDTLLTGHGGNVTVSWPGNRERYLATLLRQGRLREYGREVLAWKRENRATAFRTLMHQVGRSIVPPHWIRATKRQRATRETALFRDDFVKGLNESVEEQNQMRDWSRRQPNSARRKFVAMMRTDANSIWQELAQPFGIQVATPVLDVRVIEFCLGVPEEQYTRDGRKKLLIRRAMQQRMPREFLWNNRKGRQSGDIVHRVRRHREEFEAQLSALRQSALSDSVLNVSLMDQVFRRALSDVNPSVSQQTANILMTGLLTGLFLQQFERPHSTPVARAA